LVVEDGSASRVAGAAVPAIGAGAEGGGGEGVPVLVGPLARRLLDQLNAHSAQLVGGIGVSIPRGSPSRDAHVVTRGPLNGTKWYGGDPTARQSALHPDDAHIPVETGGAEAVRDEELGHAAHHARLAQFAHSALDGHPRGRPAIEAMGRRDHVPAAHQGATAVERSVVAQVHHEATHRGQGGGAAAHDSGLDLSFGQAKAEELEEQQWAPHIGGN